MGFSYHDLLARLSVLGPDDAWNRLREMIRWYEEVETAGGYRAYYNGMREGTLQGGGTAGGLGLDQEFFESVLVPQVIIEGFLGFKPGADGFRVEPQLPSDWPELAVDRIAFQGLTLSVRVTREVVEVLGIDGSWKAWTIAEDGSKRAGQGRVISRGIAIARQGGRAVELEKPR